MKRNEMSHSERRHSFKAAHLERLAACHKVLSGEGEHEAVADIMLKDNGLSGLDAALQAIQQGHGNMMMTAEIAAERSRSALQAMGASRRAREHGLILADYSYTCGGHGESARMLYMVALRDFASLPKRGLHRDVLARALSADLVSPASHCQHAHDCCGHWYASTPQVKWIAPNLFIVYQDSYQNV